MYLISGDRKIFYFKIFDLLDEVYSMCCHLIVCGNFNLDFMDRAGYIEDVLTVIRSFNLTSYVTTSIRPTRCSSTLIDN